MSTCDYFFCGIIDNFFCIPIENYFRRCARTCFCLMVKWHRKILLSVIGAQNTPTHSHLVSIISTAVVHFIRNEPRITHTFPTTNALTPDYYLCWLSLMRLNERITQHNAYATLESHEINTSPTRPFNSKRYALGK